MSTNRLTVFAVIPVKKLDTAKSRLASILKDNERKQFCLKMLEDVLRSVKSTRNIGQAVVISKDSSVHQIAKNYDAISLKERKTGLNQAVSEAIEWCIERLANSVLVLPSDIPLVTPTDLNKIIYLGKRASMVISSSRSGEGTNALLLTPPNVCPTFYGPCSFERHLKEASKSKISLCRYDPPRIALDIDTVEDLSHFVSKKAYETSSYKFLNKLGFLQQA